MAFTKLDIYNRALDLTGSEPLNTITQDNDTARILSRNYDKILLRCLRRFPWPFAIKRVVLAPDATGPENEFDNQFTLPVDYVRTDEVFPLGIAYRIEHGKLFSDETTITLRYVSSESLEFTNKFDPDFAEYFSHELAVAIVYSLTDSPDLRALLAKETDARFKEATAVSSQEFPEVVYDQGPWVNAFEFGGPMSNNPPFDSWV